MEPTTSRGRALAALGTGVPGLLALEYALFRALRVQWDAVAAPGPTTLDDALTLVAAVLAVLLMAWLGLSTLVSLLAHLPGHGGALAGAVASACAPALCRRVAAVVVGATVSASLAPGTAVGDGVHAGTVRSAPARTGSAHDSRPAAANVASPGPGFRPTDHSARGLPSAAHVAAVAPGFSPTQVPGTPPTAAATVVAAPPAQASGVPGPGWTPIRPAVRPQPSPRLLGASPANRDGATNVVVHRGDTLWDIVARHLGPDASDAEVAAAWPAWHEANRDVIGPDPYLVLPGQLLRPPGDRHQSEGGHR